MDRSCRWAGVAAAIAAGIAIGGATVATAATGPVPITVGIDNGGPWVVRFHAPDCFVVQNPFERGCGFGGFLAYYNFAIGGVSVATGDIDGDGKLEILTAPNWQARADVRAYTGTGASTDVSIPVNLWGAGSRAAAGDVNGDGRDDVIAAEDNGGPNVQVFDARTGTRLLHFGVLEAPSGSYSIRVAGGDVNGDGRDEIITAYALGGDARVSIYSPSNAQFVPKPLQTYAAYSGVTNAVEVAAADVNGDDRADVIVAASTAAGAQVKAFDGTSGDRLASFFAFEAAEAGSLRVGAGDLNADGRAEIAVAGDTARGPRIAVFTPAGTPVREVPGFGPRESVAIGDVDGDGTAELVLGSGPGLDARVTETAATGIHKRSFAVYTPSFQTGVRVATGDLAGDGTTEIVTGQGPGGQSEVDVFDENGYVLQQLFPFGASGAGVFVATGDVDGDRRADLVAGADAGGEPRVRIYDARGRELASFLARDAAYRGGVRVATADLDGDGKAEIVTGSGPDGPALVRVFGAEGTLRASFAAFGQFTTGGVWVASGDVDGDGTPEIVAATGRGNESLVRIFRAGGSPMSQFAPFEAGYRGDVHVAAGDVDGDGHVDVIATPGRDRPAASVRVFRPDGGIVGSFSANPGHWGGIFVATAAPLGRPLELRAIDSYAVEGKPASVQATLHDPDGAMVETDLTARIEWSDGTTTSAAVTGFGNGRFNVTGERRFRRGGVLDARVVVSDRWLRTASSTVGVTVLRAPLRLYGRTIRSGARAFAGAVARLEDANPISTKADFTARVTWGDGTRSTLRVVRVRAGRFSLTGAHTFRHRGRYRATVTVEDVDGSVARAATAFLVG